jgi:hypothetical protein
MAWYTSHTLRYRGRLLYVESRYGSLHDARVLKGKPLDLRDGSRDFNRVTRLFCRCTQIREEIHEFLAALDRHYGGS